MPRVDVGHITLNIMDEGSGPPLLFIPGLVGLLNAWEFQVAEFSKRYRCISLDHRGAGDSDKPEDPSEYSTAHIARDVIALLDTLGIDKTHVVGTSTGGAVLQNLGIDYGDRFRCCVFSNTWTAADEYIMRVQTMRKFIALDRGQEEYVKVSSLFTNGANQFRYNLDKVLELEERSLKTVAPVEILAARLDMTMNHNRLDEISKIKNPSLIIASRDDSTVPSYFSEDLHDAIEGSKLILVDEGGHYSYRRHPEMWNKHVSEFFTANEDKV